MSRLPMYFSLVFGLVFSSPIFAEEDQYGFDPSAQSFSLTDAKQVIESQTVSSVEEFIEYVFKTDPSLFDHPGLVYSSKGFQEASYENPRTILVSKNGKFAMTYNGDPSQLGYSTVEFMGYDEVEKTFKIAEADFSHAKPYQSEPSQCMSCHNSDPKGLDPKLVHPIMDSYQVWPRMYASDQQEDYPVGLKESSGYISFLKTFQSNPRYKHLPLKDLAYYEGKNLKSYSFSTHNKFITQALYHWNTDRLKFRIQSHPQFVQIQPLMKYSFEAAKAAERSGDRGKKYISYTSVFAPMFDGRPDLLKIGQSYSAAYEAQQDRKYKHFRDIQLFFGAPNPSGDVWGEHDSYSSYKLATRDDQFRLMAVSQRLLPAQLQFLSALIGIDLKQYSLTTERDDLNFRSPQAFEDSMMGLISGLEESQYNPYKAESKGKPKQIDSAAARKALSTFAAPQLDKPKLTATHILNMDCTNCHREKNSSDAPFIPFHDLKLLRSALNKNTGLGAEILKRINSNDSKTRMPRGYPPLSQDEIDSIATELAGAKSDDCIKPASQKDVETILKSAGELKK